jgi:hypothetical protein
MKGEDINRQFNQNQTEHNIFMKKLDDLAEGQNDIKVTLAGLPEQLAEKFDERYASKKYEESLDRLNWMVISAVVLALLGIVIKVV